MFLFNLPLYFGLILLGAGITLYVVGGFFRRRILELTTDLVEVESQLDEALLAKQQGEIAYAELAAKLDDTREELDATIEQRDALDRTVLDHEQKVSAVYTERNSLAVALAKVVLYYGGKAGKGYDADPEKGWDPEWRNVVYVEVPGVGQVSWHMGPNDLPRLESLPPYISSWDGTAHGRDVTWPDRIDNYVYTGDAGSAVDADFAAPQPQAESVALLREIRGWMGELRENPRRGDAVFRCGFNGALDVIASRLDAMLAAAPEVPNE